MQVQVLEVGGAEAEASLEAAARGLRVVVPCCHGGDTEPRVLLDLWAYIEAVTPKCVVLTPPIGAGMRAPRDEVEKQRQKARCAGDAQAFWGSCQQNMSVECMLWFRCAGDQWAEVLSTPAVALCSRETAFKRLARLTGVISFQAVGGRTALATHRDFEDHVGEANAENYHAIVAILAAVGRSSERFRCAGVGPTHCVNVERFGRGGFSESVFWRPGQQDHGT